jgi:vitamin B12 transporter
MPRQPVSSLVVVLSSALALQTRAADDAPAAGAPAAKPPVFYETTTVTARPVSAASGAVAVVGPEEARASAARSTSELLREVPGLNLLSSGGRAGQTNAYVRGGDRTTRWCSWTGSRSTTRRTFRAAR